MLHVVGGFCKGRLAQDWERLLTVNPIDLRSCLCEAIRRQQLISLKYGQSDHDRLVEPHALGLSVGGDETLVAWQVAGPSSSGAQTGWKNFKTAEMRSVFNTGLSFEGPRPGYARDTVQLSFALCQL